MAEDVDVVVVGAGFAGLTAARALSDAGFDEAELISYIELVAALEEVAAQVPLGAPWGAPHADEWDGARVGAEPRGHGAGRRPVRGRVQAVFAASSAQLSLRTTCTRPAAGRSSPPMTHGPPERVWWDPLAVDAPPMA